MATNLQPQNLWLQQRRADLKLSQEEVVERLKAAGFEVSRSTYAYWERGKFNPPLHDPLFRRALANAFKTSPRELLKAAGYEVSDSSYSDDAERAAFIVEQLPSHEKRLALGILEKFIDEGRQPE